VKVGILVCRDAVRDLNVSSTFGEVGVLEKLFEIARGTANDLVLVEDWKRFVVDEFAGGKYAWVEVCFGLLQIDSVFRGTCFHSESSVTAARLDDQTRAEDMAVDR
jgi:hypothetical protein